MSGLSDVGEGLHQAHHRQGDCGRGHYLLRQHRRDLRGGLADGGMSVNLRMLRRIDQGEEVEAADMTALRTCESHATF